MRKTLLIIGMVGFYAVTADAQIKVTSDAAPVMEQQFAELKGLLVDPTNVVAKKELPDAPIPVIPNIQDGPLPCPAGEGRSCALLGGRLYFRDPVHFTEHDKSWADAMKNKGMLLGMSTNAAAMVWDYRTTRHCVETHRGKEGNPLMGNSQAQELGVGISLTALTYFISGKLKKQGDGNYAFGVLWGGTMLHVLAGAHNWATCGG
jgi:hypothetical protein